MVRPAYLSVSNCFSGKYQTENYSLHFVHIIQIKYVHSNVIYFCYLKEKYLLFITAMSQQCKGYSMNAFPLIQLSLINWNNDMSEP